MAEPSDQSQVSHDTLVVQLTEHLISKKFRDVRTHLPDFSNKPAPISMRKSASCHVPDVTANGIQMVLFEVETDETLQDPRAKEKWELFASYAGRHMADFWIVVPMKTRDDARQRVATLGLNAKVMGI